MGWFSSPKKIDPQKVMDMARSPYQEEQYNWSKNLMSNDPGKNPMLDAFRNQYKQDATDTLYTQNRINKRNAMSNPFEFNPNQLSAVNDATYVDIMGQLTNQTNQKQQELFGQGAGMLGQSVQNDMAIRKMGAEAYGQNITNQNNHNAAMAGGVMSLAGSAIGLCDRRVKKDIQKVGQIKMSNGHKTGLYKFKYKKSGKEGIGVIAQDVERTFPDAVIKDKQGLRYVNYTKLTKK